VWVEAWFAAREAAGRTSTRDNRGHWEHHIASILGSKHPSEWTKDDMRALSRHLDEKVQAGKIADKTAINVWGTATRMCDDATEHKRDDIRCRAENPALGVRGPERGIDKAKEFLYPVEFQKLVSHPLVPLIWRRSVVLAVYTYMRTGELRVLRWEDVNLDNRT